MDNVILSVIMPVYNPGKWFKSSVESVLSQTFTCFELILVDDGSSDGSELLCDDFAKRDKRVKVIHIKNHGVSYARNTGIEVASGEFISFIDSDDVLEPIAFECTIKRIQQDKSSLAIYAMQIDRYTTDRIESTPLSIHKNEVISPYEVARRFNELFYSDYLSSSCTKIFRKEIIEKYNLNFNESLVMYEDLVFVLEYISKIKSVSIMKDIFYHYRMDMSIIAISKRKSDNFYDNIVAVANHVNQFLINQGIELNNLTSKVIIDLMTNYIYRLFVEKHSFRERIKGIRRLSKEKILQEALSDCESYKSQGRFYKYVAIALKMKVALPVYVLYRRRY